MPSPGLIAGKKRGYSRRGRLRKPECPHTWEPHFLSTSQLETPTGPTLEKQPHSALHTSLQRTPSCAGELSRAGAGKHLPRSHSWDGNSGLLLPCRVASQHISVACLPTRSSEKRNGACCHLETREHALLCNFPWGPRSIRANPHSLPSLARSWRPHLGASGPPDHILYIHTCRVVTCQGGVAES